jgi:prevent-host-death family protein
MTHTYSIAEARARLRVIVDQAEAGLEVELTRRGEPVAVVLSCREVERLRGKRPGFRDVYNRFLDKYSLNRVGLEDAFSDVRDTGTGRQISL